MSDNVLTPAELTYLIGTENLPPAEITDPDTIAAAWNLKNHDDSFSLAVHTVEAAFLALRDEGSVTLEWTEVKKRFRPTRHHVMVTKTGTTGYAAPTMEGSLYGSVGSEPRPIGKIVDRWFGPSVPNPAPEAFRRAENGLRRHGMIVSSDEEVDRGKLGTMMAHKKTKTIHTEHRNPQAIAGVLPEAAQWSTRWNRFLAEEPELNDHIYDEVRATIKGLKRTDPEPLGE